jgi:uroporphyrinogen-III synthase
LVTRPLVDGREIAARLAELGHQALLAPLLEPRFFDGPEPALDDVQAILATSANGVRALIRRTPRRDIPIFAVGPQTAEEATKAGFAEVRSADGDAVALAEAAARWARPEGVLLHVCGEDAPGRLADTLAHRGFPVRRVVLYGMASAGELPPGVRTALDEGRLDAVMFFSPRTDRLLHQSGDGGRACLRYFCRGADCRSAQSGRHAVARGPGVKLWIWESLAPEAVRRYRKNKSNACG